MSSNEFYRTKMGHIYFERTLPELVRQITRLNELLERLVDRLLEPPAAPPSAPKEGEGG